MLLGHFSRSLARSLSPEYVRLFPELHEVNKALLFGVDILSLHFTESPVYHAHGQEQNPVHFIAQLA